MIVSPIYWELRNTRRNGKSYTELVAFCRDKKGRSVLLRMIDPVSVEYCVMQSSRRYRGVFSPTDANKHPVTKKCEAFNPVTRVLSEKGVETNLRYSFYYSGVAMAIAETGKQKPNCVNIKISGDSLAHIKKQHGSIKYYLEKLDMGITLEKNGSRMDAVCAAVLALGLPLYGYFELDEFLMVSDETQISTVQFELLVKSTDLTVVDRETIKPKYLKKMEPSVCYMDFEQIGRYHTNFSQLNDGRDYLVMCAAHVNNEKYVVVMDSDAPDTIATEEGDVNVISVPFNDEEAFHEECNDLIVESDCDVVMYWNGTFYDSPVSLTRQYAVDHGRHPPTNHPDILGPIPDMSRVVNQPPSGFHRISRFRDSAPPAVGGHFKKIMSAYLGEAWIPLGGKSVLDAMLIYKTLEDRPTGLGLSATAKRHDLGEKKGVTYEDISVGYFSERWNYFAGEIADEATWDDMTSDEQTRILKAVNHSIPIYNKRTVRMWKEVVKSTTVGDLRRIFRILTREDSRELWGRAYEYCYGDVDLMKKIMEHTNWWFGIQQFGTVQAMTPHLVSASGQVGRVYHALYVKCKEMGYQMERNYHEKSRKYGGGEVLDPDFMSKLLDAVVCIIDYNSLYPTIILEKNLCHSTHIAKYLIPLLYRKANFEKLEAHTSKEKVIRLLVKEPKKPLDKPYHIMPLMGYGMTTGIIDGINVVTRDGNIIFKFEPVKRSSCDLPDYREYSGKKARRLYNSGAFATLASVPPKTTHDYLLQVDEIVTEEDDGEGYDHIVLVAILKRKPTGLDQFKMVPWRIWIYRRRTATKGNVVRVLKILGGKRKYPTHLCESTALGVLPAMIKQYLTIRAGLKGEMKAIKKEHGFKPHLYTKSVREEYQSLDTRQATVKIMANASYGAMGCPGPLYHTTLAMLITAIGRQLSGLLTTMIREEGLIEVYGDTDSVMPRITRQYIAGFLDFLSQFIADLLAGNVAGASAGSAFSASKGSIEEYPDVTEETTAVDYMKTAPIQVIDQAIQAAIAADNSDGRRATDEESMAYCDQLAVRFTWRMHNQHDRRYQGLSNDGTAFGFSINSKKQYMYLISKYRDDFYAANATSLYADLEVILRAIKFKGLTIIKTTQTGWGKDILTHIAGAILAGATEEQLKAIVQMYYERLKSEPFDRLTKQAKINLAKAGPANVAAYRATLVGVIFAHGDLIDFAQMKDGTFGSHYTHTVADVSLDWVKDQVSNELNRMMYVHKIRCT